jgi:hypothetical protein
VTKCAEVSKEKATFPLSLFQLNTCKLNFFDTLRYDLISFLFLAILLVVSVLSWSDPQQQEV